MGEAMAVLVVEDMVEVAALVDTVGAVPEAMEEEIATVVMAVVAAEGVGVDMVVEVPKLSYLSRLRLFLIDLLG